MNQLGVGGSERPGAHWNRLTYAARNRVLIRLWLGQVAMRPLLPNSMPLRVVDPGHPYDKSREDLVALDPSESTIIYRGFRDFVGPYVAHCHNLAHEDHAMMFGWTIVP